MSLTLALTAVGCWDRHPQLRAQPDAEPQARIVKDAIVSYLSVLSRHPELEREVELMSALVELLRLLDRPETQSESDMETVASLSSYYLGEHGGEVYSCLLIRRGKRVLPSLQELLRSGKNECRERLGAGQRVCRSDDELKSRLSISIGRIERGDECNFED